MILALGVTYAAVPLYRAFCSATGFSGTPITDPARFSPDRLYTTPETQGRKRITVHFEATSADTLPWKFEPQQRSVKVLPGETALAFYTAKNNSDHDLVGIATYNMTPAKVGPCVLTTSRLSMVQSLAAQEPLAKLTTPSGRPLLCQSRMFLF